MIDWKKILSNFSFYQKQYEKRGTKPGILQQIKEKIEQNNNLKKTLNSLREKRNKLNKKEKKEEEEKGFGIQLKEDIKQKKEELEERDLEINNLLLCLPNIVSEDTPEIENKNTEEVWFSHPIKHNLKFKDICQELDLVSEKMGVSLSGSRFVVYKGYGSRLLHGLIRFLLKKNIERKYEIFDTPYLVRKENLLNTGQLPKFSEELFSSEGGLFFLIPTAEVSLINLFKGQIIEEERLPIKATGYTPCFRREVGSAGQENTSLTRLHQFHKVEIIQITKPSQSYLVLNEMIKEVKEILSSLRITHREIILSQKELSFSAAKTVDIEVWLPNSKKWLEISSCSNCEDFQSRRAQIRIKGVDKKKVLAHTLNASCLAVDRLLITLCEYYYSPEKKQLILPECLDKFIL